MDDDRDGTRSRDPADPGDEGPQSPGESGDPVEVDLPATDLWAPTDQDPRTWLDLDPPSTGGAPGPVLDSPDPAAVRHLKDRAIDAAPVGITISDPDRPDNPLIYVNEAFERITGYAAEEILGQNCRFLQGEHSDPRAVEAMREAIDEARPVTVEVVNYRRDGTPFWNEVTIAPVTDADGEVTNFVGFQADVTRRKRAERTARTEHDRLEHLLDRTRGLVREVTRELVEASNLADLRNGVCGRIAATEPYAFAWIGGSEPGSGRVVPEGWAGATPADWPDAGTPTTPDWTAPEDAGPIAEAIAAGEPRASDDPATVRAASPSVEWVESAGVSAVAGVPLQARDRNYGAMAVYATRGDAFDDAELAALESLGRATATAMDALERARLLTGDNAVELEIGIHDPDAFFVDLARHTGSHLEYRGAVPRSDGPPLLFFEVGADAETVSSVVADHADVADATLVDAGDPGLFEFAMAGASVVSRVADQGGRTRGIEVEEDHARLRVEFPGDADPRSVLESLQDRHPSVELLAYRERERPPATRRELLADVERGLTDRQRTALRKAYVGGYYDTDRSVSGDEIAESMGISRATFHQHRRAAERKLIGELFEDV